ncbi:MAG: LacI family DNA-binding transcriptional regulator [Verrucomicrobiota bacterium]|nr:LacI family DNA-binding transcriptional regulator [Verrucomicrobiota bacterium]
MDSTPPRRVTLDHIAKAAGVTRGTVSKALHNDPDIAPNTRTRIQELARDMGYQPDAAFSFLSDQRWRDRRVSGLTIAYIWSKPDAREAVHPLVGMQERCAKLGYKLEPFCEDANGGPLRTMEIVRSRGIHGVILFHDLHWKFPPDYDWSDLAPLLIQPREYELPFSLLRDNPFSRLLRILRETKHRGYKRIGVAHFIEPKSAVDERTVAALLLFQHNEMNGEIAIPMLNISPLLETEYIKDGLRLLPSPSFNAWLSQWEPDAVIGACEAVEWWIRESGRRVPEDVGFVNINRLDQLDMITIGKQAIDWMDSLLRSHAYGLPTNPATQIVNPQWEEPAFLPFNRK